MKKRIFVAAAIFIGSQLQAQIVTHQQEDTTGRVMDEVVLTSNKYPKKQSESGKVITVINRRQLEQSGGKSVGELLNTVAGTIVTGANNAPGTNQTVSIRGASAGNVLILLDGIPVNDPSVITNYFDLNFLNPDQVERIEILKGGQSTLYGSDAVAGVINIISKKAGPGKTNINGNFSAGSYHALKETFGIGGRGNRTDYSVNYTHFSADGFSAANDKNKTGTFDKDGINQHAVSGRLGFKVGKRIQTSFSGSYNNYKTDLDASAFTDERDYTVKNENVQAGTGVVYTFNKGSLHLNYRFNKVERDYLNDSSYKSNPFVDYSKSMYTGRNHYAEAYGSWKLNQWEILAGSDYRSDNTDQSYFSKGSFGPYSPPVLHAKMNQLSAYASLVFKNDGGFGIESGGRWNMHSEYGNNFTFSFNPSYLVKNRIKVFANLYSAFKTPTLYQLFDPSAGNAELKPENGIISEAGAEVIAVKNFHTRVTGFYRSTKNAILYTFNPSTFASQYKNISKQKNYGAEFEAGYTAGKFSLSANYTYTNGKTRSAFDGTGSPIGKDSAYFNLYHIPKNAVNLAISLQASKSFFIRAELRSLSKREEFIYGSLPESLKGYTTIDLYGEYRFDNVIRIFLELKNITDTKYFDILGYNSRRFNFTTGVSFQL